MATRGRNKPLKQIDAARSAVLCQIVLSGDTSPSEIPLFPAPGPGGMIPARDGRKFRIKDPVALCAAFNGEGHDCPVDFEHSSQLKAPRGDLAPAAGWMKSMSAKPDGSIWASVDWTPAGGASVASREYRYTSPAFFTTEDGDVTSVISAALTNVPALRMPALAHLQEEEEDMDPELLKALGLEESASAEQAIEAVKKMQAEKTAAVQETASAKAAHAAELASVRAQVPGLDKFVPRADFDAAQVRIASLEQEAKATRDAAHKKEVDAEIQRALEAGKITPATKDFYTKTCSTAEGLAEFRKFAGAAPVIAPSDIVGEKKPAAAETASVSEFDLQVATRCGLTKEQLEKSLK